MKKLGRERCLALGKEREGDKEKEREKAAARSYKWEKKGVRRPWENRTLWRGFLRSLGDGRVLYLPLPASLSWESVSSPINKFRKISKAYLISDVAFSPSLQTPMRSRQSPRMFPLSQQAAHLVRCTTGRGGHSSQGAPGVWGLSPTGSSLGKKKPLLRRGTWAVHTLPLGANGQHSGKELLLWGEWPPTACVGSCTTSFGGKLFPELLCPGIARRCTNFSLCTHSTHHYAATTLCPTPTLTAKTCLG